MLMLTFSKVNALRNFNYNSVLRAKRDLEGGWAKMLYIFLKSILVSIMNHIATQDLFKMLYIVHEIGALSIAHMLGVLVLLWFFVIDTLQEKFQGDFSHSSSVTRYLSYHVEPLVCSNMIPKGRGFEP